MDEFKKQKVELIIDQYYRAIGVNRNDNTRERTQVQARAAIITALRKHMTFRAAGSFFDMDHSSALYHFRNHEDNMEYWPGYAAKYRNADRIVRVGLEMKDTQARIKVLDKEIDKLMTAKKNLIKIIEEYEQLQIQDH